MTTQKLVQATWSRGAVLMLIYCFGMLLARETGAAAVAWILAALSLWGARDRGEI